MKEIKLYSPPKLKGKYLKSVLASGHLTAGPMVSTLASRLEDKFGPAAGFVIPCASATAGWQAILDVEGPAEVEFVPRDRQWPLFPALARTACRPVGPKLCCVADIGACYGTVPLEKDPSPTRRVVVHDACHSWEPARLREWSEYSLVSFYPTKLVPGAEGGAIFCRVKEKVERLLRAVNSGFSVTLSGLMPQRDWHTWVLGRKAHMTDVQAALNLEALELSENYSKRVAEGWEEMWDLFFRQGLCGLVWHTNPGPRYLFQVSVGDVTDAQAWFRQKGIPTGWNFPPERVLTLPAHSDLTSGQRKKIVKAFAKYVKENKCSVKPAESCPSF